MMDRAGIKASRTGRSGLPAKVENAGDKPRRLSFRLKDVLGPDERPLEEVFEQALAVINGRPGRPCDPGDAGTYEANWLAKVAIRAVCESIIAAGCLPLPLAVAMHHRERPSKTDRRAT